jgi:fluoride exporter
LNLINILAVAVGGSLGSVARYLVGIGAGMLLGTTFPWGTVIINIVGSFTLGALIETFALRWSANEATRVFLTIGICGGFTTFSTFSMDAVVLMIKGATLPFALYVLSSVALSLAALYAGLHLMRAVL